MSEEDTELGNLIEIANKIEVLAKRLRDILNGNQDRKEGTDGNIKTGK